MRKISKNEIKMVNDTEFDKYRFTSSPYKLEVVFENVEGLAFYVKDIAKLNSYVKTSVDLMTTKNNEVHIKKTETCGTDIYIKKEANKNVDKRRLIEPEKTDAFERIIEGEDIVGINLISDDGQTINLDFPWTDKDCGYASSNQITEKVIDDDGNEYLHINLDSSNNNEDNDWSEDDD